MNRSIRQSACLYTNVFGSSVNVMGKECGSIFSVLKSFERSYYQTSDDRNLKTKQEKQFPKLTQEIYVQRGEVATHDGYKLIEPVLEHSQPPHELHLIKKIGKLNGEPWWVREAMKKLGFSVVKGAKEWKTVYNVQPNTPEVNKQLWLCKHLVKVTPITFKNGVKNMSEADLGNTRLNLETGEFEIIKRLEMFKHEGKNVSYYKVNDVSVTEELKPSSSFGLDVVELKKDMHRQKELCKLNDEYFPADYDYKYDQDIPGVTRLKGKPDTSIMEDGTSSDPAQ